MITVDQIREQLNAVVDNRVDLDSFDEWLSAQSWNMHKDSNSDAIKMVGKIELLLADIDGDRIPLESLMHEFRGLAAVFERLEGIKSEPSGDCVTFRKFEWTVVSDKRSSGVFSYTPLRQV